LNPSQICQSFQGSLEQSRGLGFASALFACVLSGLAGIDFEKILKGSADVSVWMRNVQLSLLSLPLGFALAFIKDGAAIEEKGFFFG
jgi:UDP-sugar transporter A1/2/3